MISSISRSYKAWRTFETRFLIINKMISGTTKVMLAPADLIHVFGPPSFHEFIEGSSTIFNFEDSNLDCFKILDRHQTQESIDLKQLNLKNPPYSHRGKSTDLLPVKEFWKSKTPAEFWVEHTPYADVKNFVDWMNEKIAKGESAFDRVVEKYGEINYNNKFDKKYEVSRDYAVFRYNKLKWD